MFKSFLAKIGISGASIDTRFDNATVQPGGYLRGNCLIRGGAIEQEVEDIYLCFRANARHDDKYTDVEFYRVKVADRFWLKPNEPKTIPFSIQVPYELPVTIANGYPYRMQGGIYVKTDMEIADALDSSDRDVIHIEANPAMAKVLSAFDRLGFQLFKVDLEYGRLQGSVMPFFQEFEYTARNTPYARRCTEIEVSFIGRANEVEVVIEIDKRGGFFTSNRDVYRRIRVPYQGFEQMNLETEIHNIMNGI